MSEDKSARKERDQTDQSLRDERDKTDEKLSQVLPEGEQEADATLQRERERLDRAIESERAKTDRRIAAAGEEPTVVNVHLVLERNQADVARQHERADADEALEEERAQRNLIAEALLAAERAATDHDLVLERSTVDDELDAALSRLSAAQSARLVARAAVAARDWVLAVVCHDLRNPLAAIVLNADSLATHVSRGATEANLASQVELIRLSAATMRRLLDDLADAESIALGKLRVQPEEHDVCALITETRERFAQLAEEKSITLAAIVSPTPLIAHADRDRVLQVLSNLVGNALKFTPAKGTVTLRAGARPGEIWISVVDTGPGIPADQINRVFDRYMQLKRVGAQSLGLGLYVAKSIVDAHRGKIWVESVVGAGSTFQFTLPAV